ncbi:MAG: flagellar biosynthesis repressor FlbT [Kiloniellaceae bacterium]
MPLKLSVSSGEKFIVNGAVIRNDGDNANLVFENQAQILRQKDILSADTATTPAARVYFALQCAYLFPERASTYLKNLHDFLGDYVAAAPSAKAIADEILKSVECDQLYQGLKFCGELINHEREVLSHVG